MSARGAVAIGRWAPLLVLVTGCASTHSLTPLALDSPPTLRAKADPAFAATNYVTFSVFALSATNPDAWMKKEHPGRAVCYSVRNILESYGYRFVYVTEHPDFLVGVDVDQPLIRESRAALDRSAAELAPGHVVVNRPATAADLAPLDQWGWGIPEPSAPGLPPMPGYPPPAGTKPPPPGYARHHVTAVVLDGKTMAEVWAGAGTAVSYEHDPRIATQVLFWEVLRQLPGAAMTEMSAGGGDIPGMSLEVVTNDGANFFPAVRAVESNSPAWKCGVMDNDLILAIGGESVWGKPIPEIRQRLQGPANSTVALTLWRSGRQVNVFATRSAPASADPGLAAAPPPAASGAREHWRLSRTGFDVPIAGR